MSLCVYTLCDASREGANFLDSLTKSTVQRKRRRILCIVVRGVRLLSRGNVGNSM